jgi:hypothetical protein
MEAHVKIEKSIVVRINGTPFRPKLITYDNGQECIALSATHYPLVAAVASVAGVSLKAKMSPRPSLTNVSGYIKVKHARNEAQAASLVSTPTPKAVFGEPTDGLPTPRKRQKRTAQEIAYQRVEPQLFDVTIPNGDTVSMQRPVKQTDELVIPLDEGTIKTIVTFIVEDGVTIDTLTSKRDYAASGVPGTWKTGPYFYNKDGGKHVSKVGVCGDGDDEDSQLDVEDEDVVGEDSLPDACDEDSDRDSSGEEGAEHRDDENDADEHPLNALSPGMSEQTEG